MRYTICSRSLVEMHREKGFLYFLIFHGSCEVCIDCFNYCSWDTFSHLITVLWMSCGKQVFKVFSYFPGNLLLTFAFFSIFILNDLNPILFLLSAITACKYFVFLSSSISQLTLAFLLQNSSSSL